jgi:hypothetical protein
MLRRTSLAICLPPGRYRSRSTIVGELTSPARLLEGRVASVQWRNPHAEAVIEVGGGCGGRRCRPAKTPAQPGDRRRYRRQDATAARTAGDWGEFALLSRMEAWGVTPGRRSGELIGHRVPANRSCYASSTCSSTARRTVALVAVR